MDDGALKQHIDRSKRVIADLLFRLAVERKLLRRLKSLREQPQQAGTPRQLTPGTLAYQVASLLRDHGGPMRVKEIVKTLQARGLSDKPTKNLVALVISAVRRRQDAFERVRPGVYGLITQKGEGHEKKS